MDFSNPISEADQVAIKELSQLAHELTGVQLSLRHQSMVASRLAKRVGELGLASLAEYVTHFKTHRAAESPILAGLLTTHHTYFFREFSHFEFIQRSLLAGLIETAKSRPDKKIRIWSAACSRGQEAYSLAMFLDYHLKAQAPSVSFDIFGTDVDPASVETAQNGVYLRSELKEAPNAMVADHWARGKGAIYEYVKAKASLRDRCRFSAANLLELRDRGSPTERFDLIFCRNVFIYFNEEQIRKISAQLLARLAPEGHLFVGISESLSSLKLPLISPGPSVYRAKPASLPTQAGKGTPASKPAAPLPIAPPALIRVLCVDDSPSVLTLLTRILSKEAGFEIVGTAKNGKEAAEQRIKLRPDAITLDIHMPVQTGIEYLRENLRAGHPPVVMVTSVSREDSTLAIEALTLGAADFVEKPALNNLEQRGEELRNKIRCSILASVSSTKKPALELDRSFKRNLAPIEAAGTLRVIALSLSSRPQLKRLLGELAGVRTPIAILVEGMKETLPAIADLLSKESGRSVKFHASAPAALEPGSIALLDMQSCAEGLRTGAGRGRRASMLVLGDVSTAGASRLLAFQGAQLLLEDLGSGKGTATLNDVATDIVPVSSFAYMSDAFLAEGPAQREAS